MTLQSSATGRAFRIANGRLVWEPDEIPYSADEMNALCRARDIASDSRREVVDWLKAELAAGRLPSDEIHHRAALKHIPHMLLWTAKKQAGIEAVRDGKLKRWFWKLPEPDLAASVSNLVALREFLNHANQPPPPHFK